MNDTKNNSSANIDVSLEIEKLKSERKWHWTFHIVATVVAHF